MKKILTLGFLTIALLITAAPELATAQSAQPEWWELARNTAWCGTLGLLDPSCWIKLIAVVGGTILVNLAALLLGLADMLFGWTFDNTVLLFKTEIFQKAEEGINAGWTALRDIANIVIIGMLTFTAISTILGIQEYAAKKFLARVLIIAVLINFSLLFTKLIIDASNFTAGQFYAAAAGTSLGGAMDDATKRSSGHKADIAAPETSFRKTGISGAFMRFSRATSISGTGGSLFRTAYSDAGGALMALGQAVLAVILLGGAALVLFYGSYLLISRALLFIFLMITAAGAFATYLIPGMSDSRYGWKGWWSSLLHNAALAPILMVLIWVTIQVSSKMSDMREGAGGTLGTLADPKLLSSADGGVSSISELFSFIVIIGLLYASFLLASKWAGKVGGLSMASMALTVPFNLGSQAVGFALKKGLGGGAALIEKKIGAKQGKLRDRLARYPDMSPARKSTIQAGIDKYAWQKGLAGRFAKQNYNPIAQLAKTKLGQTVAKQAGFTSPISAGDAKSNFADDAKKVTEAAVARAEAAYQFSTSDQRKMREKEEARRRKEWQEHKQLLTEQAVLAARTAEASEQQTQREKARLELEKQLVVREATDKKTNENLAPKKAVAEDNLKTVTKDATAQKATVALTSDTLIKKLQDELSHAQTPDQTKEITGKIKSAVAEKQAAIDEQDVRIRDAQKAVKDIENRIGEIDRDARKETQELDESLSHYEENAVRDARRSKGLNERLRKEDNKEETGQLDIDISRAAERVVQRSIDAVKKPGAEAAERYAANRISALGFGAYVGGKAKTMYEDKQGKTRIKKDLETYLEDMLKPESASTVAPTPPATPGTTA
ncbi:MAG: hypothetical protein Q7S01_03025 [bacterium]|nr:hypothetical protein [bacterium]